MAQTKRKRQTKHRGNQAGSVESRGRTSRPTSRAQARQQALQRRQGKRVAKATAVPTWRSAIIRAGVAAAVFFAILLFLQQPPVGAIFIALIMFGLYIPMSYYTDLMIYRRRQRKKAAAS